MERIHLPIRDANHSYHNVAQGEGGTRAVFLRLALGWQPRQATVVYMHDATHLGDTTGYYTSCSQGVRPKGDVSAILGS